MKKLMKKKNNKGFSLVELIVVVLILGIIAVALAPQVMKWVGTARKNSDENTKKDIKSAVQIALAEWQKDAALGGADIVYSVSASGLAVDSGTDWSGTIDGTSTTLMAIIARTMGDTKLKPNEGTKFLVKIDHSTGVITVGVDSLPTS